MRLRALSVKSSGAHFCRQHAFWTGFASSDANVSSHGSPNAQTTRCACSFLGGKPFFSGITLAAALRDGRDPTPIAPIKQCSGNEKRWVDCPNQNRPDLHCKCATAR